MVDTKNEFQKYSSQIQILNEEREDIIERRSVELFFSFDIVNSSAYKTLNFTGWSKVIMTLFGKIQQKVVKKIPSAEMWRVLGDEVIFIVQIKEKQDIFIYISTIFEILNTMVCQLKSGEFFDEQELDFAEQKLMKMQNILSLKAAAWIAIVGEELKSLEPYDNLIKRFKLQEGYGIFEFLGNDIDTGFRIKAQTQDRRFNISFELAYILSRDTDYLKNLNIITYKRLKGIWQERLYPIIWYHDKRYTEGKAFEDSFYYDEKENSELVKEYFLNRESPLLDLKMYLDVDYALRKILLDQKLTSKLTRIFEIIDKSKNDEKHLLDPQFLLRLHCVAVCHDKECKKVLIMKRAETRKKYPGYWEFGCAKGCLEKSIVEQVVEEYKEDFNIKINVQCDSEREDKQPIPLAMYEVESEQGKDKGVIMLAEIIEEYNPEEFSGLKHSEAKWIMEEEIDNFNEQAVPDFKNTLKLVFAKLREGK